MDVCEGSWRSAERDCESAEGVRFAAREAAEDAERTRERSLSSASILPTILFVHRTFFNQLNFQMNRRAVTRDTFDVYLFILSGQRQQKETGEAALRTRRIPVRTAEVDSNRKVAEGENL